MTAGISLTSTLLVNTLDVLPRSIRNPQILSRFRLSHTMPLLQYHQYTRRGLTYCQVHYALHLYISKKWRGEITMKTLIVFCVLLLSSSVFADSPYLVSPDGTYLGNLNNNRYDPNSVSNPYGQYGSQYSPNSINNPYGTYGSPYSNKSPNNPYATQSPRIYGR